MALFYIEELNKFTRTQRYDMVNMKVGYQVTTLLANWLRVQTMSMHCNERKKVHINMKTSPICNGPFDGNTQALRVYNQMVMRSYPSTTSGSRGSCHTWIFSSHYDAAQSPERLTRSPLPPSNKRRWTWTDGEEKPETQCESRLEKPETGNETKCVGLIVWSLFLIGHSIRVGYGKTLS